MANCFDGAILLDNGVGSTAVPGAYIGFGRSAGTQVSSGPRIYAGTGDPSNVVTAPRGSLWIRTDDGTLFQNTDGAATWASR